MGTWKAVGRELGFNQGYVNRVAYGKRRPSKRLMGMLGIRKAKTRPFIWQRVAAKEKRLNAWASSMICYLLGKL